MKQSWRCLCESGNRHNPGGKKSVLTQWWWTCPGNCCMTMWRSSHLCIHIMCACHCTIHVYFVCIWPWVNLRYQENAFEPHKSAKAPMPFMFEILRSKPQVPEGFHLGVRVYTCNQSSPVSESRTYSTYNGQPLLMMISLWQIKSRWIIVNGGEFEFQS